MIEYCHGFERLDELDFAKNAGLIPAVVQNCQTGQVLMLGYMNEEAVAATLRTRRVTFYSRARRCLWVKGENSGNFLHLRGLSCDCDRDTLLVLVRPDGPTCHLGTVSCFDSAPLPDATARYLTQALPNTAAGR